MATFNLDRDYLEACSSAGAQGDLTAIRNLLDNEDTSAALAGILCIAAYHGHREIIKVLLSRGADVNSNQDGETALLAAVRGGQAETIQLLIENGADVHARLPGGVSALHQAVMTDRAMKTETTLEIIDQLLREGLEIENRDDDGRTIFHEASFYGRSNLINGLIVRGVNVNAKDNWDDTPLDRACLNGHIDTVRALKAHEIEINTHLGGCEGLSRAARIGHLNLFTYLLDIGAKAQPIGSQAPELLCAARSGVSEMVHLLIDRGFSSQGPRSLLRAAVTDSVQVVAQLVDHGVNVNARNNKQQTPLHLAVLSKQMERQTSGDTLSSRNEVINFLIEKGADINAMDVNGKNAFNIATELGYFDAASILNIGKP